MNVCTSLSDSLTALIANLAALTCWRLESGKRESQRKHGVCVRPSVRPSVRVHLLQEVGVIALCFIARLFISSAPGEQSAGP